MMDLYDAIRRRRMVRHYRPDPVEEAVVERIVDAARRAPSAGFAQGQRFVVVTEREARRRVAAACDEEFHVARGLPRWISRAPVHVIPCVDPTAYERRYAEPDKRGSGGPAVWEAPFGWIDLGASFMLLLLAAVAEGLAAGFLWVEAHRLRAAVAFPEPWQPMGVVTIGHPAADDPPGSGRRRPRLPLDEVVHRPS